MKCSSLQDSDEAAAFGRPLELAGGPVAWLVTRLYAEFNRMDAFSLMIMHGTILEILGQAARQRQLSTRVPPSWLKRVTEFLHESLPDELTA